MSIKQRRYKMLADFEKVSDLLRNNFTKYQKSGNITQPRWEYAHVHPAFNCQLTHRFGIWEENGEVVGVASYEMDLGECFMNTKFGYEYLKPEMIKYAEKELYKPVKTDLGEMKKLIFWVFDYEQQVIETMIKRGYEKKHSEPVKVYKYEKGFPERQLPEGFSLISLEDENDIGKIHQVMWKGFDHGDQPDDDLDCRLQMQSAPHFRKDLTIIAKAPNGDYACFCGMWRDGVNDYAYTEPLATDPKYRGLGLAAAAITQAMKRTRKEGTAYCFGGGGEFYSRIGFETIHHYQLWLKEWK